MSGLICLNQIEHYATNFMSKPFFKFEFMLLAMIVAVRQALDYRTTGPAVAVCALGWILAIAIAVVLAKAGSLWLLYRLLA